MNAVIVLGELGPIARDAVPCLMRQLDDESLMGSVLTSLGQIGPDAKAATPKLLALLDEQQPWVSSTLAKIGADPEETIPALTRASTNGPIWLQKEAALVLSEMKLRGSQPSAPR